VAITVIVHAIGTSAWVRHLSHRMSGNQFRGAARSTLALVNTVIIILILHTLEIIIWALAYLALVPTAELASLEEAMYFSFVTFSTLGYGDITLSVGFRLLSGIEALNGIILVGWSTAMIFSVVQHMWRNSGRAK
jgi:hypothetical protein